MEIAFCWNDENRFDCYAQRDICRLETYITCVIIVNGLEVIVSAKKGTKGAKLLEVLAAAGRKARAAFTT